MNETDLETEINSLIRDINNGVTTSEPNGSKKSNPGNLPELYQIEKQITKLRKELYDTQNKFVTAKNLLSKISFQDVNQNFKNQISLIGEKCQLMLNDQCQDEHFFDSFCEIIHQCHDIPELHTMATALNELRNGISKMENNHLLLADLYEDVWKSVACSDTDNTVIIQQNLEGNLLETMHQREDNPNM